MPVEVPGAQHRRPSARMRAGAQQSAGNAAAPQPRPRQRARWSRRHPRPGFPGSTLSAPVLSSGKRVCGAGGPRGRGGGSRSGGAVLCQVAPLPSLSHALRCLLFQPRLSQLTSSWNNSFLVFPPPPHLCEGSRRRAGFKAILNTNMAPGPLGSAPVPRGRGRGLL